MLKLSYLSIIWKHLKGYVKYDIVFLKYTQISTSLICFLFGKVELMTCKSEFFTVNFLFIGKCKFIIEKSISNSYKIVV